MDINDKRWVGKLLVRSKSSGVFPLSMLPLETWICDVFLVDSLTSESNPGKFGNSAQHYILKERLYWYCARALSLGK